MPNLDDVEFEQQFLESVLSELDLLVSSLLPGCDAPDDAACALSDPLLAHLMEHRETARLWIGADGAIRFPSARGNEAILVEETIRHLQDHHQYLEIEPSQRQELEELYRFLLTELAETLSSTPDGAGGIAALAKVLKRHRVALRDWLTGLTSSNLGPSFAFARSLCEEYSPEVQLRVLDVHLDEIEEPILDLGCGRRARLVHFLSGKGKAAFGVDRAVIPGEHLVRADWFEYDLGTGRWGTVLSHMALSNHFLHHHLRPDGHPERYAQLYMDVLRSLKPRGCFHYAPGLPFIEGLLPSERYAIQNVPLTELAGGPVDTALTAAYGKGVLYTCKVTRRVA